MRQSQKMKMIHSRNSQRDSSMPYWSVTSAFNYDSPAQQELPFNTKDLNPDKRGLCVSEDDSVSDLFDRAPFHNSDQEQDSLLSCKDSAYRQSLSEIYQPFSEHTCSQMRCGT